MNAQMHGLYGFNHPDVSMKRPRDKTSSWRLSSTQDNTGDAESTVNCRPRDQVPRPLSLGDHRQGTADRDPRARRGCFHAEQLNQHLGGSGGVDQRSYDHDQCWHSPPLATMKCPVLLRNRGSDSRASRTKRRAESYTNQYAAGCLIKPGKIRAHSYLRVLSPIWEIVNTSNEISR